VGPSGDHGGCANRYRRPQRRQWKCPGCAITPERWKNGTCPQMQCPSLGIGGIGSTADEDTPVDRRQRAGLRTVRHPCSAACSRFDMFICSAQRYLNRGPFDLFLHPGWRQRMSSLRPLGVRAPRGVSPANPRSSASSRCALARDDRRSRAHPPRVHSSAPIADNGCAGSCQPSGSGSLSPRYSASRKPAAEDTPRAVRPRPRLLAALAR
jgi:hypothetical protein